jgi:predicted DNA-binding transcriptional regulator AlpA
MNVLRWSDVEKKVGWCKVHIRRKVNAGEFPKPIKLDDHRNGRAVFIAEEVEDWLQEKADAR